MKTATANLEEDHVHILRLIDVMQQITTMQDPDVLHLESIVDLIKNFADGLHHAKEENLLFPKMAEKGFSFKQGPVAVMLNEHELGRKFVKGMADNIQAYKRGNFGSIQLIYENMHGYIGLLRAHIAKENNILFRMADNALSPDEQTELLTIFEKVEKEHACSGLVENCISRIDELARIYLKEKVVL